MTTFDDSEQPDKPAKPKKGKTFTCFGGPLDGAEVEAKKVFDGEAVLNIYGAPYTTGLRKPDDEMKVWQPCNDGAGDSVVRYRHEKGGRLVYAPPKKVDDTLAAA